MRTMLALIAAIAVAPGVGAAPSVDCGKARDAMEQLICNDQQLAALDQQLAGLYRERLAALDRFSRRALRRDQVAWANLNSRIYRTTFGNDTASRHDWLVRMYDSRIATLRATCAVDSERTLEERSLEKEPWGDKVPKGFSVRPNVQIYVTINPTMSYVLPSRELPAANSGPVAGLRPPYRELISCSATAPDGSQWLVVDSGWMLSYIWAADAVPAGQYDAEVQRETWSAR